MKKETIKKPVKILFVCLGNICRSPAAEGVFLHLARERGVTDCFEVDSAGTYGGHAGDLPDPRMRAHAARRGYLLEHRSRPVQPDDFDCFDLILGMDDGRAFHNDTGTGDRLSRSVGHSTGDRYDRL